MFVSPAYAQTAAPAAGGDMFMTLLPLLLIFVVFYFLLIRPQQSKMKQHRDMIEGLKKGDQVVTSGGIIGKITKVDANDATLMVEIAPNVQVKIARNTVADLYGKVPPPSNENRPTAGGAAGGGFMGKLFGGKK